MQHLGELIAVAIIYGGSIYLLYRLTKFFRRRRNSR